MTNNEKAAVVLVIEDHDPMAMPKRRDSGPASDNGAMNRLPSLWIPAAVEEGEHEKSVTV